jgi:hypothetical protein
MEYFKRPAFAAQQIMVWPPRAWHGAIMTALPRGVTIRREIQHGIDFIYVMGGAGVGKTTYIDQRMKIDKHAGLRVSKTEFDGIGITHSVAALKQAGVSRCYVECMPS